MSGRSRVSVPLASTRSSTLTPLRSESCAIAAADAEVLDGPSRVDAVVRVRGNFRSPSGSGSILVTPGLSVRWTGRGTGDAVGARAPPSRYSLPTSAMSRRYVAAISAACGPYEKPASAPCRPARRAPWAGCRHSSAGRTAPTTRHRGRTEHEHLAAADAVREPSRRGERSKPEDRCADQGDERVVARELEHLGHVRQGVDQDEVALASSVPTSMALRPIMPPTGRATNPTANAASVPPTDENDRVLDEVHRDVGELRAGPPSQLRRIVPSRRYRVCQSSASSSRCGVCAPRPDASARSR